MNWNLYRHGQRIRAIPYSGPAPDDGWELLESVPDEELTLDKVRELQQRYTLQNF